MPDPSMSISKNEENYQDYIVNLSTIHKLAPISVVLENFAQLHYQYANSWLGKWYSKLWVSLHYLKLNRSINDYKLGKIDTDTFIEKLQEIFYFIPADKNPKKLLENAWNSLILWDTESTSRFLYLLALNKPIFLISNTNPLNIEKIKRDIDSAVQETWQWQKQEKGECKFQIHDKVNLMTSYENTVFKTDGLIEKLVDQLLIEGKTHEDIILVSQYKADLTKAKELGIDSQPADEFFSTILKSNLTASQAPLNNAISAASSPTPIPLQPNNLLNVCSQPFFTKVLKGEKNPVDPTSENTPLLGHSK